MKKRNIVIIILITILFQGIIGFIYLSKNDVLDNLSTLGMPSCPESNEFFTHAPVALDDIESIIPLGNVSPPSHTFPTDHIYFSPPRVDPENYELGVKEVNVYAPGDVKVTRVWRVFQSFKNRYDYTVFFSPCREIEGFFIHLETLTDKILNSVNLGSCEQDKGSGGERCESGSDVELSAGELIGTAGAKDVNNFDLGMYDTRVDLTYANPKRWRGRMKHNVCPFDYFTSDLKESLYNKLGTMNNNQFVPSTADPICGTIEQDVPGTAQGVWFFENTKNTYPENNHLALIPDNFDATLQLFSVGESISGVKTGRYYFEPRDNGLISRDFSQITPGDTYCYEARSDYSPYENKTIFIIQMEDKDNLKVEFLDQGSCGNGPWHFDENSTVFER